MKENEGDAMGWKFVLSLFFALVVAVFAIQNADAVAVKFLAWNISISQALIVLISAIFGAIAVAMLGLISQMRLKSTIRSDKKEISSLSSEIDNLKAKLNQMEKANVEDVVASGSIATEEGDSAEN